MPCVSADLPARACAAKACLARLLGSCVHAQDCSQWRMRSVRHCSSTRDGLAPRDQCAADEPSVQRAIGTDAGQHGAAIWRYVEWRLPDPLSIR